jgi:hypothetical protein
MLTGVYKPLAGRAANLSGHFRSVVIVNSVEQLSQITQASADISAEDLKEMKELAAKEDVLDILGRSLAPSIYGHDWIKKVHANHLPAACPRWYSVTHPCFDGIQKGMLRSAGRVACAAAAGPHRLVACAGDRAATCGWPGEESAEQDASSG